MRRRRQSAEANWQTRESSSELAGWNWDRQATSEAANSLGSSPGRSGLRERKPWRERFRADLALPSGVLGPVESRALRRLASIWRWEGTVRLGSRVNPTGAGGEGAEEASG